MRSASWVVIDREWTNPKFLTSIFPSMRNRQPLAEAADSEPAYPGWRGLGLSIGVHLNLVDALASSLDQT